MFSYEELKARIEHEKNSLRFYVLYWHILKKDMSEEECYSLTLYRKVISVL